MCLSCILVIVFTSFLFISLIHGDRPTHDALEILHGYREFKDFHFKLHEDEFVRLVQEGQNPHALLITCSDSRIVPNLLTSSRPGLVFTLRNAGNFVIPYNTSGDGGIATIQYAVEVLGVKNIIVCGHSHCGAIESLYKTLDPKLANIIEWLKLGEPAKNVALQIAKSDTTQKELNRLTERISVVYQLHNLMSYPFIKKLVDQDLLTLHGWYYTIETGEIEYYDSNAYDFKPLLKQPGL